MNLKEIPVVAGIKEPAEYKYIVAEVECADSKHIVVRADIFVRKESEFGREIEHRDVYRKLCGELEKGTEVRILGGGWLWVKEQSISVGHYSATYGVEPDREQTCTILRKAFPDRKIRNLDT